MLLGPHNWLTVVTSHISAVRIRNIEDVSIDGALHTGGGEENSMAM
jgi:hypothetical protein